MLIGACLSADITYSQNNFDLRVPLITKDERILSAHRAIIENRLKMLNAGEFISAIGCIPEKYSFIMDDPFLNDEEFWGDAERVQEVLRKGNNIEDIVGSKGSLNSYFEELDQSIPHIVDVVASLLQEKKYSGRKFVCLGRAADFIYWTMLYFLGDARNTQSCLIDISHKLPDARPLIKANKEAFKNFLMSNGLKEDDSILVVDEFSSCAFPEEVSFMFKDIGFTDVMGIDLCHHYAENVKGKGWKSTHIPGSIWGYDNGHNQPAVMAMDFLGTGYQSGRSYNLSIEDGKWKYVYKDTNVSSGFGPWIKKNGKYWNWFHRKRLYDYLLDRESELDNAVQEIRELHNKKLLTKVQNGKLFLKERIAVSDKYGKKYFIEEVKPNDMAGYIGKLDEVLKKEEKIPTQDNYMASTEPEFRKMMACLKGNKYYSVVSFFVLKDAEENIIGAHLILRGLNSGVITGLDAVRIEYQNKGLGTRFREIVFGCLKQEGGIYSYEAEIASGNDASERSLQKALGTLNIKVPEHVVRYTEFGPLRVYKIELGGSSRHDL